MEKLILYDHEHIRELRNFHLLHEILSLQCQRIRYANNRQFSSLQLVNNDHNHSSYIVF